MILDSLNNTKKIECLHPLFKKAFDYLKSTDFSKVEDGKHELDGSRLYVSVVSIFGKEKKDAAIETHKKYIDIQMPLLGVEKIGWKPGCEQQRVLRERCFLGCSQRHNNRYVCVRFLAG